MSCKQVLVIDDDEAVRQTLGDVLELQGYEVITAEDGQEGIDRLSSCANQPCVILLDMMMPGLNGWQFLDFQRSNPKLSNIPVIVCSAFSESAKTVQPAAIVPKPVELKTLMNAVQRFCG